MCSTARFLTLLLPCLSASLPAAERPNFVFIAVDDLNHFVTLQDLYPTVTALAGLPRPGHVHGYDLSPLLEDPSATGWPAARLTTFEEGNHALRTTEYHYIRYNDGIAEFYDLAIDPFQLENRIAEPSSAATFRRLDAQLDALLAMQPADFN